MKPADQVHVPARGIGIDWQAYHQRLDRLLAALELQNEVHEAPEQARAVMDERARALARAPAPRPRADQVLEVVTFALAGERYAIETCHVRRVEWPGPVTPVPGAPDFLAGVVNLGGEVVDVIDLRSVFGLGGRGTATATATGTGTGTGLGSRETSPVIVLGDTRDEFGILADAVDEVRALRTDDVLEPVGSVLSIDRQHLRGVTGDALIVLDGAGLIRDHRLVIEQGEGPGV
jgi:purine-binding chemotaxis protein CheW